jgi:hypothetical protein
MNTTTVLSELTTGTKFFMTNNPEKGNYVFDRIYKGFCEFKGENGSICKTPERTGLIVKVTIL